MLLCCYKMRFLSYCQLCYSAVAWGTFFFFINSLKSPVRQANGLKCMPAERNFTNPSTLKLKWDGYILNE